MNRRGGYFGGLAAEEIAARLYASEGAQVLATRWRCAAGEIDLILGLPDGLTVFVEVKARRGAGAAAHALRAAQMRRLGAAAEVWLAEAGGGDARFDVVLVDGQGRPERMIDALRFDFD